MIFYEVLGRIDNENWDSVYNNRNEMSDMKDSICRKVEDFNQDAKQKGYYFVSEIKRKNITIGIISTSGEKIAFQLKRFFLQIGIKVSDYKINEITIEQSTKELSKAERLGFIRDDFDVLIEFEIERFTRRFGQIPFEENIAKIHDNEEMLYDRASNCMSDSTFLPELDRIHEGGNAKESVHPVHYKFKTDDEEIKKDYYELLIEALYTNGRLKSKRYSVYDFILQDNYAEGLYKLLYSSSVGGTVVFNYIPENIDDSDVATYNQDIIDGITDFAKKYRNEVLTVFSFPRGCEKVEEMFSEKLDSLTFITIEEDLIYDEETIVYLENLAARHKVEADDNLFKKIEPGVGYYLKDLNAIFDEWYSNIVRTRIYPQYKEFKPLCNNQVLEKTKGTAYDELNSMIGLDSAKKVINQALDYYKAQRIFADKGMTNETQSMHMIFTGNPGTAKTTVARLFSRIMKDNKILSEGQLIEVGRGDLVGKFVGWTAKNVQKYFQLAIGGVLFIDEAYSLVDDRDGSYGDEAINTIVQEMENHRDEVVVIFAGYPDKMEKFLDKNPGLRSRIAFHVDFEDYNSDELCDIARLMAEEKDLKLSQGAMSRLHKNFDLVVGNKDFGNGRYVRNIIQKARMSQASRLVSMDTDKVSTNNVKTILAEDIPQPEIRIKNEKATIGFTS